MSFQKLASLSDFWTGELRGVSVKGKRVLLVHLDDGVHAYEDRCAHLGVPLSEGRLEGGALVCSAHEWCYEARTGCGINPSGAQLRAFPVRVDGDDVLVDVDAESGERDGVNR